MIQESKRVRCRMVVPLVLLLAAGLGACSSEAVCTPGQQVSCACPGGDAEGVQTCNDDGSGLEPCQCGDGGPGAGDGGDASDMATPLAGLYARCQQSDDCDAGLSCAGIGVTTGSPNQLCTLQGCDPGDGGDDLRCQSADGTAGKCFEFSALTICLPVCSVDDDCSPGLACNQTNGACFSSCSGDADCAEGTLCDPDPGTPEDRRLCIPA